MNTPYNRHIWPAIFGHAWSYRIDRGSVQYTYVQYLPGVGEGGTVVSGGCMYILYGILPKVLHFHQSSLFFISLRMPLTPMGEERIGWFASTCTVCTVCTYLLRLDQKCVVASPNNCTVDHSEDEYQSNSKPSVWTKQFMTNYHTTYSETKQWERVMMNSKYLCQIPLFDTCPFF